MSIPGHRSLFGLVARADCVLDSEHKSIAVMLGKRRAETQCEGLDWFIPRGRRRIVSHFRL